MIRYYRNWIDLVQGREIRREDIIEADRDRLLMRPETD